MQGSPSSPNDLRDLLAIFVDAAGRQEPVTLITVIKSLSGAPPPGAKLVLWIDGGIAGDSTGWDAQVLADAAAALAQGHSQSFYYPKPAVQSREAEEAATLQVYVEVACPPALLVVGAGHIGACVARLGKMVGFRVSVLDDRPDFANRERLPEVDEILCEDFVTALQRFPINDGTYIVVVTRGHKQDESALRQVIDSTSAYVGMIGSRRRASAVLKLLRDSGVAEESLARIRTPIGLDIHAETPEEIAVSIIAELLMERRGGTGLPLSQIAGVTKPDM
ncbi:MAG: hypothetical protein EXR50_06760 [Dehalococcoidia bacterium]|nr:hypothetical protein [Dehalococcoidia bacterium]